MTDLDYMTGMPELPSAGRKRSVLIVEDDLVNRELLRVMLEQTQEYEIRLAHSGAEGLQYIRGHSETLSLVLLDLNLPGMHGMDILRIMKDDPFLGNIPVIVLTSETDAEVESLNRGASDFISKPYPMPEVVQARVRRTIELSENRDLIRWTERDHLTGLYNREYFYRYAEQYDLYHRDDPMDAVVVDISHFHLINERYSRAFADGLLQRIGRSLLGIVRESGGLVCRREADTFQIYCPHREDYALLAERITAGACVEGMPRCRLRLGVYSDVDKSIEMQHRFDRAKSAADTIRSSYTTCVAVYDNALHEQELFAERLLESFPEAIEHKQFVVYFQPKYDIRPAVPLLCGAEALVRWQHPELGMVSPGIFIPLFESNGLIRDLDNYVWRETAARLRDWKERLGFTVPVSVNVSRIDMMDPDLPDTLRNLLAEHGLDFSSLHLEITESAYTQDAVQIISTVTRLRDMGFVIEMDDFGSGYSSLNMLSSLPIDVLKLDMQFIRSAFSERGNTRMLEVTFDISDSLSVPMIAEGVETAEQMLTLRAMGCDIVQGYYFARPMPTAEFDSYLEERRMIDRADGGKGNGNPGLAKKPFHEKFSCKALRDPVTGLYNGDGFDMLYKYADREHSAVLAVRVLSLPEDTGEADRVLKAAADTLRRVFRPTDLFCRTREDEFIMVATRVDSESRGMIAGNVSKVSEALAPASLAAGAAFSDRENPCGDLLRDAKAALQRAVRSGNGCCVFY